MVEAADQMFTAVKFFQYSLCRVVLMVADGIQARDYGRDLSVLALSSRFDGLGHFWTHCRRGQLSVLALSSRFDGQVLSPTVFTPAWSFSTRSVESF